jgi:hypothetical protein
MEAFAALAQVDAKLAWQTTFEKVREMYRSAFYEDAKLLELTYESKSAQIKQSLGQHLLRLHTFPMAHTLRIINTNEYFKNNVQFAQTMFIECMLETFSKNKVTWMNVTDPQTFFDKVLRVFTRLDKDTINQTMRIMSIIEQCWITRYLAYPHAQGLGRNDAHILRNLLLKSAVEGAFVIANRNKLPDTATNPSNNPNQTDQKTNTYPPFQAAVSIFGRPVVPIGFTAKLKSGGTKQPGTRTRTRTKQFGTDTFSTNQFHHRATSQPTSFRTALPVDRIRFGKSPPVDRI